MGLRPLDRSVIHNDRTIKKNLRLNCKCRRPKKKLVAISLYKPEAQNFLNGGLQFYKLVGVSTS